MAIDWDKFQDDLDQAIEAAGERTDRQLAGRIAAITRLTDDEVRKLFPDPADVRRLAELMAIVKRAGDRHEKINRIVANAEQFGGVILTLLAKLA
jgi:hypothetical protein